MIVLVVRKALNLMNEKNNVSIYVRMEIISIKMMTFAKCVRIIV